MIQHRRFAKEASDHTGRSAEREMFIVIGQMRCAGGVSIFINILDLERLGTKLLLAIHIKIQRIFISGWVSS